MKKGTFLILILSMLGYGCGRKESAKASDRSGTVPVSTGAVRQGLHSELNAEEPVEPYVGPYPENAGLSDRADALGDDMGRSEDAIDRMEDGALPAGIPVKPDRPAPRETSLKIIALMTDGDEPRIHVVDETTSRSCVMSPGDNFQGYRLKSINVNERSVVLETEEGEAATVTAGVPREAGKREAHVVLPFPGIVDTSFPTPDRIEPTQAEIEKGIDPNDLDTWPLEYKGPGIERMLNDFGDPVPVDANRSESVLEFNQTESERIRGIDPNDPNTWPEDYKGPGIERARLDE